MKMCASTYAVAHPDTTCVERKKKKKKKHWMSHSSPTSLSIWPTREVEATCDAHGGVVGHETITGEPWPSSWSSWRSPL